VIEDKRGIETMIIGPGDPEFVHLAVTDASGGIHVHPTLAMAGFDGQSVRPIRRSECVPIPEGSDFFSMPGRAPVGWDSETEELVSVDETQDGEEALALATFLAPAWTRLMHPATLKRDGAPSLPLFAYSVVGVAHDGTPLSMGIRIDPDPRQDPPRFDRMKIELGVERRRKLFPNNGLVRHITHCALVYGCRAAQNYFLGRWEAPIPIARACNANCVGCISLQKDTTKIASHDRIGFNVSANEVAELAIDHIQRVPTGIVSFGQGCEGEPLLNGELAVEAVRKVRAQTQTGTLHINTNASRPDVVHDLFQAGLDSMRVSTNSTRSAVYEAYYRPVDYSLEDVIQSMEVAVRAGKFLSLNYLVFPGITDTEEELESILRLYERAPFKMIQWRNLNIDPDEYIRRLREIPMSLPMGLSRFMEILNAEIPNLRNGYFNPPKERFLARTERSRPLETG
jgi:wyosine [tRNA(Phe)-imidazoG37] synthetase (radical SAM superfamily)